MENYLLKKISLEEANSGSLRCLLSREFEGFPQRLFGTFFRKKVRKGSFFEHTGAEMTRLLGDDDHEGYFTKNYQRWMEGEAKRSKNRFEKPLFSGGPSTRQLTQMAATIAASASPLGPMGAMAVTAAFSCYDVAQGNMDWKHAVTQTAVSGVAGMAGGIAPGGLAPYAGQLVTMAASGIDYKEGGGIGWSNDNLKAGVKSGVTSMAMNYALGQMGVNTHISTGIQSGVMSSLDFNTTDWYKIGLNDDNDKWDSLAIGATSAIGSWAASQAQTVFEDKNDFSQTGSLGHYTSKLINNFVSNSLLAGYFSKRHDISYADALTSGDSEGNYGTNIWGNALYTHQDVGGWLGAQAARGIQYLTTTDEERAQQKKLEERAKADAERQARQGHQLPVNGTQQQETLLGGLWQGIKKIGDDIESLGNMISGNGFKTDEQLKLEGLAKLEQQKDLIKNAIDEMSQKGGTNVSYDLKYILAEELGIEPAECQRLILDGTGATSMNEVSQMLRDGSLNVSHVIEAAGGDNLQTLSNMVGAYADISDKRVDRNNYLAQQRALEQQKEQEMDFARRNYSAGMSIGLYDLQGARITGTKDVTFDVNQYANNQLMQDMYAMQALAQQRSNNVVNQWSAQERAAYQTPSEALNDFTNSVNNAINFITENPFKQVYETYGPAYNTLNNGLDSVNNWINTQVDNLVPKGDDAKFHLVPAASASFSFNIPFGGSNFSIADVGIDYHQVNEFNMRDNIYFEQFMDSGLYGKGLVTSTALMSPLLTLINMNKDFEFNVAPHGSIKVTGTNNQVDKNFSLKDNFKLFSFDMSVAMKYATPGSYVNNDELVSKGIHGKTTQYNLAMLNTLVHEDKKLLGVGVDVGFNSDPKKFIQNRSAGVTESYTYMNNRGTRIKKQDINYYLNKAKNYGKSFIDYILNR